MLCRATSIITYVSRVASSLSRLTIHVVLSPFLFLCLVLGCSDCFLVTPATPGSVWVALELFWGRLGEFFGPCVYGGGSPPCSPSFYVGGSSYRGSSSADNRSSATGTRHSSNQSWVMASTSSLDNKNWVTNH